MPCRSDSSSLPCLLTAALVIPALLMARPAAASLGQSVSSIEADRHTLGLEPAAPQPQDKPYEVYEIRNSLRDVHEYAAAGRVFAVTWQGLNHPDLSVLLGDYFAEFHHADAAVPMRRSLPIRQVRAEHVVVQRGGRMGHVFGRAIAPALVPAGVNAEELP